MPARLTTSFPKKGPTLASTGAHRLPARIASGNSAAVIGLGRFGGSVAVALERSGVEVLGVDSHAELVAEYAEQLTFVAQADSTSTDALRQHAIPDFDRVVLGIGADLQASILTASHLIDFGIANIWAKAINNDHARILRQLGLTNVIQPEAEMGRMLAATILEGVEPVRHRR